MLDLVRELSSIEGVVYETLTSLCNDSPVHCVTHIHGPACAGVSSSPHGDGRHTKLSCTEVLKYLNLPR